MPAQYVSVGAHRDLLNEGYYGFADAAFAQPGRRPESRALMRLDRVERTLLFGTAKTLPGAMLGVRWGPVPGPVNRRAVGGRPFSVKPLPFGRRVASARPRP